MIVPENLRQRLDAIVADVFALQPSDVTAELAYGSVAPWDSVGHLDLLIELEREFGFALTADLIPKLVSVRAILEFLGEHGRTA